MENVESPLRLISTSPSSNLPVTPVAASTWTPPLLAAPPLSLLAVAVKKSFTAKRLSSATVVSLSRKVALLSSATMFVVVVSMSLPIIFSVTATSAVSVSPFAPLKLNRRTSPTLTSAPLPFVPLANKVPHPAAVIPVAPAAPDLEVAPSLVPKSILTSFTVISST